jgi:hypothetical protein
VKTQVLHRGNNEVVVSTELPLAAAGFLLLWRGDLGKFRYWLRRICPE